MGVWGKLFAVMIPAFAFYMIWVLFAKCINLDDIRILKSMNLLIPRKLIEIVEKTIK